MLAVVQTHPIQYQAPVYRALQERCGVPVTALYGSDFSVAGYRDADFGTTFAWDTDLLSGYASAFLGRVADGGARSFAEVSADGLGAALARLKPAAVLAGGYSPGFHRAGLFHAWRLGIPILFRAETTSVEPTGTMKAVARRVLLRAIYARCDRLLYIGRRSRRHYEELGCAESKLVSSPYCVDASAFDPSESDRTRLREDTRRALEVGDSDFVVMFCGKLTPKKRPDLLLEALPAFQQALGQPVVAAFVGEGELRGALEATAHSSTVRARFVGFKNQRELSPYYHASDLFVLPSQHSETWGLVVNEALCHGLPSVVSSAVGCAEDLVQPGRTGDIFPVGSSAGLSDALLRARTLSGQASVRAACRALVSEYSVERAASGIADAYRAAVGG